MKVFGAAFAAAILFFGGAAQAQSGSPKRDAADAQWSLRDLGSCHIVLNHGSVRLDANGSQWLGDRGALLAIRWSGACDANGLITGRGVLQVDYDVARGDGFTGVQREVFEGQATQGRMDGQAQYSEFDASGENGSMLLRWDDGGDYSWSVQFDGGCIIAEDGERLETACAPASGEGLKERYLTSKGVPLSSASAAPTAPSGQRVTAVSTPSARAGRNPFLNSCLSLKAPEGDREPGSWGANIWTIQNSCQTKLYVTWCADDDGREASRNICANKAAVTNELLAGGTIIFQSVARELSIQAFACRAPDFPQDAGFTENRRLTASGCP